MKIYFEDTQNKVWSDDHLPYVFSTLSSMPENVRNVDIIFDSEADAIATVLKRKQGVYAVCDISSLSNQIIETLCDRYQDRLKKQFDDGLTYKAFIVKSSLLSSTTCTYMMNINVSFPVSIFDSVEEAVKFVDSLCPHPAISI